MMKLQQEQSGLPASPPADDIQQNPTGLANSTNHVRLTNSAVPDDENDRLLLGGDETARFSPELQALHAETNGRLPTHKLPGTFLQPNGTGGSTSWLKSILPEDKDAQPNWQYKVASLERAARRHDDTQAGIQMRSYGGFPHSHDDDDTSSFTMYDEIGHKKPTVPWRSRIMRCAARCCSPKTFRRTLVARLPILHWCRNYTTKNVFADLIAGMTVGLTVIPQGLAYAAIANLPLQYGLYSAYMGCFVYMFLGTSKDLNLGPTAVISLMTAEYLSDIHDEDERVKFAVLLTFMTGLIQLALAALQLGFLTRFISHPVIAGFSSAAALIIALSQIDSLFGFSVESRSFMPSLAETITKLPTLRWPDFTLGLVCVLLLTLLKRMGDKAATVPATAKIKKNLMRYTSISRNAIIAILASIFAGIIDIYWPHMLTLTKHLKAGIPAPRLPEFFLDKEPDFFVTLSHFGSGLVLVPLISLVEALAIGKAFGNRNNYQVDSTQEFFAVGAANLISSLFSSYPVTGSFSRSALSSQCNSQTPACNLWTAALVVFALALLSPLFHFVPKAGLSAIIICAVLPMIEWNEVKLLWRMRRVDLLPLFATFFGCLVLGIELGLALGVLSSLALLLYAVARPEVKVVTWLAHNLVLIKPQSALYFPSGEYLQSIIQRTIASVERNRVEMQKSGAGTSHDVVVVRLLLDAAHIVDFDSSAMQSMKTIVDMVGKQPHMELYFVNLSNEAQRLLTMAGCSRLQSYESLLSHATDAGGGNDAALAAAEIVSLEPAVVVQSEAALSDDENTIVSAGQSDAERAHRVLHIVEAPSSPVV